MDTIELEIHRLKRLVDMFVNSNAVYLETIRQVKYLAQSCSEQEMFIVIRREYENQFRKTYSFRWASWCKPSYSLGAPRFRLSDFREFWQTSRWHCCWPACHISNRFQNFNTGSQDIGSLRHRTRWRFFGLGKIGAELWIINEANLHDHKILIWCGITSKWHES